MDTDFFFLRNILNSPGLQPFGVCDHALVVGLLIPRRECPDPTSDLTVHLLSVEGLFSSLWRSTGRFSFFFWSPRNLIEKSSFFAFSKNR